MTTNLKCLYCDNLLDGSGDHVILSALGGRKQTFNACCRSCNNRLGGSIDRILAEDLRPICNLLDIETGRGQPAPPIRQIDSGKGYKVNLSAGSGPQLARASVKTIPLGDGRTRISILARDKDEIRKLAAHQLERFRKHRWTVNSATAEHVRQYLEPVKLEMRIGGTDHYRSAAKMMLNFLCSKTDPIRLRSERFLGIRRFIDSGTEPPEHRVSHDYTNPFPETERLSEVAHRTFIIARNGAVLGLLELFGGLRFSAILSDSWDGPSVTRCYSIDPLTGKDAEYEVTAACELNRESIEQRKYDFAAARTAVLRLMERVGCLRRQAEISAMAAAAVKESFEGKRGVVTEELIRKVAKSVAERIVAAAFKIDSSETFDAAEFLPNEPGKK